VWFCGFLFRVIGLDGNKNHQRGKAGGSEILAYLIVGLVA
jgi:hypothetical protein